VIPTSYDLYKQKQHSMARANLNKSVWLVTNTTKASKYIPRRTRISFNWNPPQTSLHKIFKNFFYEVNLVSQCSHLEVLLLGKKGGFQLMQILILLLWCCGGICHQPDTLIQIGSGHTVTKQISICVSNFFLLVRKTNKKWRAFKPSSWTK